MPPIRSIKAVVYFELTYFPITLGDEVKYICKKIVNGSCILSIICEMINALNGFPIMKMSTRAISKDIAIPNLL